MPKLILIVEDEEDNLRLVVDIVEGLMQHQVLVATDGNEAIRLAHEHHPDLILMDLTLPKLDGWQATRSLRSVPEFRNTPIIALTAHAMIGDRDRALEAGCDDFFTKPINIDAFLPFVQSYLAPNSGGGRQ